MRRGGILCCNRDCCSWHNPVIVVKTGFNQTLGEFTEQFV